MPTLNPGYFDIPTHHETGPEPVYPVAAVAPDAMHDSAAYVSWLGLAALAIAVVGAVLVG